MRYVWRHGNLPILLLTLSGFMTACFDSEMEWKELNPEASATPSPSASAETTTTIAATTTTTSTIEATPSPSPSATPTISAFTWTGAGGDAFWNTAANWLGGSAPGPSDTAVFNSTCSTTCNVTISNITTVGGISMDSTYTGTITQIAAMNLTIGSSGFTLAGGTFNGSSGSITINTGSLVIQGGTFTGGSGNITLSGGSLQISSGSFASSTGLLKFDASTSGIVFNQSGGSFAHNGGSVKFTSAIANTYTINASSVDFYSLALSGGAVAGSPEVIWEIIGGSTINTVGDFAFGRVDGEATGSTKINTGALTAKGGVRVYPGARGGSGTVVFGSTTNQTYTWEAGTSTSDRLPNVMVYMNTPALTLTPNAGTTQFACQTFNLQQGAFTAPTGTMSVFGEFIVNATITSFAHSSGSITLFQESSGTYEVAVPAGFNFYNLSLTAGTNTCCSHPLVIWNNTNGGTVTVLGNFEMKKNAAFAYGQPKLNGGTLEVRGHLTLGAQSAGGTANVLFSGPTAFQTYTNSGGTAFSGTWTISKTAGKALLGANMTASALTVSSGTLDLAGYNVGLVGTVTLASGAALRLMGGETFSHAGGPSIHSGSFTEFYGTGTYTVATGLADFGSVRFNAAGTWNLAQGMWVYGSFELSNGTVNANGVSITLYGSWIKSAGSFGAGTSTVYFWGNTPKSIYGANTFYNLIWNPPTSSTLSFPSGSTQTITNQLTLQGTGTGSRLALVSLTPGAVWYINPPANTANRTMNYLTVTDSNNLGTSMAAGPASGSVNGGNCTNWTFP